MQQLYWEYVHVAILATKWRILYITKHLKQLEESMEHEMRATTEEDADKPGAIVRQR